MAPLQPTRARAAVTTAEILAELLARIEPAQVKPDCRPLTYYRRRTAHWTFLRYQRGYPRCR